MKKTLLNTLTITSLFFASTANAQVGIGVPAENIHPSAELEVKSSTKGFLPPRMTKAQRIAIGSPAIGLIVYQTDGDVPNPAGLYYFDGLLWKNGIGAQGHVGATGENGAVGPKGDTGLQGIKGDKGETGADGAQGLPGAKGDKGDQGIQGPKGDKGDVGATGPQGAVGSAGPKGDTGEKGEPGKDGVAGTSGQSVLFNPTTPPTNGMVVYKYFQNNTTTPLYDDGQIRLRLNIGSGKLYLTNVNKNFANIWLNFGNGNFYNFGTGAAMGNEVNVNVFGNFISSNHQLQMYISAPDNPSYGLYVINIYFNAPTYSLNYSNMTVNYYKDPTATP
jgi:hypothetical protein